MTDTKRDAGYRGSLPPREDRLARIWVVMVAAAIILIFVLAALSVPSRFIPEPTPIPIPTLPEPSPIDDASPTEGAAPTDETSPTEEATQIQEPTPSPAES